MILTSFGLGFVLAIDAMTLAFAYGMVMRAGRLRESLKLAGTTGFFQFFMPVAGFVLAELVFDYVQAWSAYIACTVFCLLGLNFLVGAFAKKEDVPAENSGGKSFSARELLAIGFATAIDAFAVGAGIRLGEKQSVVSLTDIFLPAVIIGLVTFVCVSAAFHATGIFMSFPKKPVEIFSAFVLIALGVCQLF